MRSLLVILSAAKDPCIVLVQMKGAALPAQRGSGSHDERLSSSWAFAYDADLNRKVCANPTPNRDLTHRVGRGTLARMGWCPC